LKKVLKYTLRGLGILIGIIVLIYIAVYTYVVYNKKVIIEQVRKKISEDLTGDVKIGNIDISYFATFPQASVLLENVSITDTMYFQHHHPFFQAQRLYAQLNVLKIITKADPLSGIRIDNGQVYVFTDTSGYTNSYLFQGKKRIADTTLPKREKSIIKRLELRNVKLIMDNRLKHKLYDFDVNRLYCNIKTTDSILLFKTKDKILIHSLAFNTKRGSFAPETLAEGNINFRYNKDRKLLTFENVKLNLKGHPFTITGNFNLGDEKNFALKIETKKIMYDLARSLLTPRISANISKFKADAPVDAVAEISGPLNGGDPLVKVDFASGPNNIQTPFFDLSNTSFTGSYIDEIVPGLPRTDPNSRVQFHNVKGDWQGIPFSCKNVVIDNLVDPTVNCDLKTNFQLATINDLLNSKSLKLKAGNASLNITYTGPLGQNNNRNTLLNGKFAITDGLIAYRPRNIELHNLNGTILFKNTDVFVTDVHTNISGNRIEMNGSAKNLLSLIKTNPGKIILDWNVHSPALNLETFTTLLRKRETETTASPVAAGKLNKVSNQIDRMMDEAAIRLNLQADKVEYKRFNATDLRASINMATDSYNLENISLEHANGSMRLSGYLRGENEYFQEAKVKVKMENVDVNKVLYAFNNFGQDAILSDNLQGKLSSDIDIRMDIDRTLKKAPTNLEGYIDFSLKKGSLHNFQPIQKLQNFLFKNRNFSDIYFAELKDRFEIKDRDIKINRMEIQSTALSLFVEGVYSLKGNTDISIQVPLSNLKKRDETYNPENLGTDAKGGTSVFVRGRPGEDGNIKFKYDLFKKFRKTDEEKEEKATKKAERKAERKAEKERKEIEKSSI
jgi:hypothetical protein